MHYAWLEWSTRDSVPNASCRSIRSYGEERDRGCDRVSSTKMRVYIFRTPSSPKLVTGPSPKLVTGPSILSLNAT